MEKKQQQQNKQAIQKCLNYDEWLKLMAAAIFFYWNLGNKKKQCYVAMFTYYLKDL